VPKTPESVPSFDELLSAADNSHRRLADAVSTLTDDQLTAPSYDSEWTIAQVLSHLGSGAEIFGQFVEAGRLGLPAPGVEAFTPVWERWDAKLPRVQSDDAIVVDRRFLDQLEALGDSERQSWTLTMFGGDRVLTDVVSMRLSEHAIHTWDVVVALDDQAVISPDAVSLLIDGLDQVVARVSGPVEQALRVNIVTYDPSRRFLLVAGPEGSSLEAVGDDADQRVEGDEGPTLDLPAEALIRLVFGRLDGDHTPPLQAQGIDLDVLRQLFPGF
jgi:uncharacterized protein (TIGR03083 family)